MKKRVMIFDDDPDILEVCCIILESNGFEVETYGSCEDLVSRIDAFSPDAILMDNKIPPIGGIAASRQIRDSPHGRLPIVFFSANHNVAGLAKEATADYFLEKPFDIDKLVETVDRACASTDS